MPTFDWEKFADLPGDPAWNWERLCGAVVRRNFGSLGDFRYVAQQPGVEFHLKLERSSTTLGEPGRWWGWQCRWYDLSSGRIGATRRKHIEEAIRRTEKHVPGITDWVLWTKRPLTPTDQAWFDGLESKMRLRLWTEVDLDTHLVGEAEILRRTYFGDLVLTPESLRDLRAIAIAPIEQRWTPEIHVEVGPEREIRRILGDPVYWPELEDHASALTVSIDELSQVADDVGDDLRDGVVSLADDLQDLRETLEAIAAGLTGHGLANIAALNPRQRTPLLAPARGRQLARSLSRQRHPASFAVMAGLAQQRDSAGLISRLQKYLSTKAIAVIGPAGCGKTQLGAALTAATDTSPCGLYLEAWPLSRRGTVNELLARLEGAGAESFVQLLEGVEAAGARAGIRLPVVIDGLNESEDPANWKEEISRLKPILDGLQHVVLIVTLRPLVAQITLPDNIASLELQGFDHRLTEEAARAYFEEYKIDPGDVRLPLERFRNPLFLRIFCEATNPNRESQVTPEQVPASLTAAFIEFERAKVERIAQQRGGVRRYEPDVRKALADIALSLWKANRRSLPFDAIRELVDGGEQDWTKSLARTLRDEGILGAHQDVNGGARTVILFDAFAGFLIADALIRERGRDDFAAWLAEAETAALLGSDQERAHPLASDIRRAFVGLVPRRFPGMQFWELVQGDLRQEAILDAADLEGQFVDAKTVAEIARASVRPRSGGAGWLRRPDLLERFREVRDAIGHPLNAEFVDNLLSGLPVADRDLRWTEWIRNSDGEHVRDLRRLAESWKARTERTDEDRLHALWVKWLLTSTVRDLRDVATLALYWYGRGEPRAIFELTLDSLDTNDPYVLERLLAASFGVTMAAPGELREFGSELDDFIEGLWTAFCADDATNPTDHWLVRHYVEGIVAVAGRYYPPALGSHSGEWRFVGAGKLEPIARDDPRNSPSDLVYGLDFANYTVGRLVPARGNYQFDHPDYQEVCSWIRARVWELGWRAERFSQVERHMREEREYRHGHGGHVELYRKKYGWVGFFEAAGRLVDEDRSPLRDGEAHLTDVDIDPSFPTEPASLTLKLPGLLSEEFEDLESWVTGGSVEVPDEFLRPLSLGGTAGPWVALCGFLNQEDIGSQRRGFGFLHAVLVERENEQQLRDVLYSERHPKRFWELEPPKSYYVFAGEMPWSECARSRLQGGDPLELYTRALPGTDGASVPIELPAHYYEWESYHSVTNQAGNYPVPAVTLAESFDLRVIPATLDWCDSEGRRASITLAPPPDFEGSAHFLYFREDLIRDYCSKHNYELLWLVWGEREVWFADYSREQPSWLSQAYADYSNVWRRIASLGEVALT